MKILKHKIIYGCEARGDADIPYLTRWEFLSSDIFAIYLHKFHRSDDNSSLHDHPWNFITIPLWRGYYDCQFNGGTDIKGNPTFLKTRMWPLIPKYRPATHVHYVELIDNKIAWTLIIRFKYIRWWGFWRKGIFTRFDEYFKINKC
jgi:hypothetical protein